ncbi:hypothetical protein Hanom_Chr07g00662241 [Helianthus anomalus]
MLELTRMAVGFISVESVNHQCRLLRTPLTSPPYEVMAEALVRRTVTIITGEFLTTEHSHHPH